MIKIIAEIGINHNGDLEIGKKLIEEAKADAKKIRNDTELNSIKI